MYPPLCFLPRTCNKTFKVPNSNIVIENGMQVFMPIIGLQRDPEFYPNPEIFDPERFNTKNKSTRPDFTYLPFGEGPRMCTGKLRLKNYYKIDECDLQESEWECCKLNWDCP